jgi:hypothetical protein
LCAVLAACAIPPAATGDEPATLVSAGTGWRAEVVLDVAPTGVWFVAPFELFPQYAEPELVALDDLGRAHVIVSYGGRWTVQSTGAEGSWLGVAAQADLDPRIAGAELYLGAESGRIWQLVAHEREGVIDRRLVAQLDGRPIHGLAAGRFGPGAGQRSLLAFCEPAEVWRLTPRAPGLDGFAPELVGELDGRVRQAIALPREDGTDQVLCAARSGWVGLLDPRGGPSVAELHRLGFGRGRVALQGGSTVERGVAYSTAEDGTIWRHAWGADGPETRRIFSGAMGPRGIACGRFVPNAQRETVAIFGYSGRVQLLTAPLGELGEWSAELLFEDRTSDGTLHRGHYLSAVELDGRNETEELVLCGYSGRVVLLARTP